MKLGIIGSGMIVGEALKALKHVPEIEINAIFVRPQSYEKGDTLSMEYGIREVYTDYEKLLNQADIDFAYIANINSVHYEYALKALRKGKHVIIEKPICTSLKQYESLMETAREYGKFVFEAVTFLHAPFFPKIQELVRQIGTIRLIQCNYSKYSSRYDRYLNHDIAPVFNPQCHGGALLDLNIYSINLVAALFGYPKGEIKYHANKGFNGIDISGTLVMEYDGFTASCTAAKDSYSPCFDIIQGEKGYIRIYGSPDNLEKVEVVSDGQKLEFSINSEHHRMVDEFRDFEKIYRENNLGRYEEFCRISRDSMKIADQALKSACMMFVNS